MLSKEEYKRNLIRMWDSIRNNHKGEEICEGVSCSSCPFYEEVCSTDGIKGTLFHSYEAIEIVEQWAKEHPVKTNAEKFKEVFGIEPSNQTCVNDIDCENCEYYIPDDKECRVQEKFWNAEYKEQAKEGDE